VFISDQVVLTLQTDFVTVELESTQILRTYFNIDAKTRILRKNHPTMMCFDNAQHAIEIEAKGVFGWRV